MNPGIQHPHDKLFRAVFSDIAEAELFLRAHLPPAIVSEIDWTTLALIETSFVDDALRDSESDLLYTVQKRTTAQGVFFYLLFEHQSTPDRWMRFRLLKYMCRIWDESFKDAPDQVELRPVLPLVFYQGESSWRYSVEFIDLFPESERSHSFIPRFAHYLVDQSDLSPDEVKGGLKARVAQLLMMAAYHASMREALAQAARLVAEVSKTGGLNYVEVFVVYLVATQERRKVQEFVEHVRRYAVDIGGSMLTFAEELKQEGRQEGRREGRQEGRQVGEIIGEIKGRIETIEDLLDVGLDWAVITTATGIDPVQFAALKERLQQLLESAPDASRQDDATHASGADRAAAV